MLCYLIKATRKPILLPESIDIENLFDSMKFLNKSSLASSGMCLQFISKEDKESADAVEIGSLGFAGIKVLDQWGGY